MDTIKELEQKLGNPPAPFRSVPFWAWNAAINAKDTLFQIDEMKEQGMGGFFIHSREGLETPYLSEEWMAQVDCAVQKAKKEGMEVWIYDEDKWPSGSAGGMVSAADPEAYTAKGLTFSLEKEPAEEPGTRTVGVYPYGENGYIVLRMERSERSEWYNHMAPSDNLNPAAVQEFIKLTHERYRDRFSGEFGKTIRGFFTDEPNCYDFYASFHGGRPWVPWTTDFAAYFEEKRGYDPLPYLPALFVAWEKGGKLRHDYWRTVTELFSESYMKQIYDWCEDHRLLSTGHMLYENDLGYQARVCGAAMPQYRYLHCPGIDLLGEQTKEYLTVKQCASVAHQYGREMTITEAYGCTGWEFSFDGQRRLMDWQAVSGITRRCQHLALYSITGCRKRDYPPVFNYQTTWWKENHYMEDYCGNLSMALSAGEVVREVLVIHPMSSIWMDCMSAPDEDLSRIEMNMGWTQRQFMDLNEAGEELNRFARLLLGLHVDFDFGDEIILSGEGRVEGGRLWVKCASYTTVIVSKTATLFESTLSLLRDFAEAGGRILWVTPFPAYMEGEASERITGYLNAIIKGPSFAQVSSFSRVAEGLRRLTGGKRQLSVVNECGAEEAEVLSMLRRTADGWVLFLVNTDWQKSRPVQVHLKEAGSVRRVELFTGELKSEPAELTEEGLCFLAELAAGGSALYLIGKERNEAAAGSAAFPYVHPHAADAVIAALGPVAEVRRTMKNVLPLDLCTYSLRGEADKEVMPVWQAQRRMREALSFPQIYYNGAPQRYTWLKEYQGQAGVPFSLTFSFTVKERPGGPLYAVVEKPEKLALTCNGRPCIMERESFLDCDMKLFLLSGVTEGEQTLTLSGMYTADMELEDMFLIGEFAVDADRAVAAERGRLRFGDWCLQGYPHYPGSIVYRFTLPPYTGDRRLCLKTGAFSGTLLKAAVDGREAGILLHAGERLLLPERDWTKPGLLELTLVGSPRNMFGPFHQSYTGCSRISWEDFRTKGRFYTPDYVLKPYGIMEQMFLCEC